MQRARWQRKRLQQSTRLPLAEAEAIIAGGCVGHNQLRFYPAAIQLALELGDHDEAERYAAALDPMFAE